MNRIDCRSFEDRLERLMSGRLNPNERRAAEEHMATCSRCEELYGLTREELGSLSTPPPVDLVESILERTSGSPCARASELLCDLVDRALPTVDGQLVRLHLESCPRCSHLHTVLVHLGEDLPAFAHLEPDAAFVSEVLARTRETLRRRWPDRLVAAWRGWLARPRAAWEMGYVGAIVLWVVFAAPVSPARGVPLRALAALQQPVAAITDPEGRAARVKQEVLSAGLEVWQATTATGSESLSWLGSDLKRRYDRTGVTALDLGRRGADLGEQTIDRLWQRLTGKTEKQTPIDPEQGTEGRQQ